MTVPKTPNDYQPLVTGHPTAKVNTADPRYRTATEAAHRAGLTQEQFSQMLGFEAARVVASRTQPASAAPAPNPAAPSADAKPYAERSFAEKLAAAGHL